MRAGLIYRNISRIPGGAELVAASMLNSLKRSGFKTFLLSGKKFDADSFMRNFKTSVPIDQELILPFWFQNVETYLEFVLPWFGKPFCDVLIDAYDSAVLPWVDVTYFHFPRTYLLDKRGQKSKAWRYYYKPYQLLEHVLSSHASGKLFLANSRYTADLVKKQLGLNPIVLYPPVDVEKLIDSKSYLNKRNLVLTISRFSSEKNLEEIPFVAKRVKADFVIMGSIDEPAVYRRLLGLIRDNGVEYKVKLILNAPLNTKIELLQKAKVYFHPMHSEHFGISIIEGMAAGCIPVVQDSGGPKEFVPDKWRYKDSEKAIQKIQEALDSWRPSIAQEMKTFAYKFRKERFENEFLEELNSYLSEKTTNL
ncbi:MAG: glycosyltransferase [Candidatus Bathyarchaeia archaeon]|jgi:glycosyltransferase involved in cell wall biosynthesis